jgi:hypothetical protein
MNAFEVLIEARTIAASAVAQRIASHHVSSSWFTGRSVMHAPSSIYINDELAELIANGSVTLYFFELGD